MNLDQDLLPRYIPTKIILIINACAMLNGISREKISMIGVTKIFMILSIF